MSGFRELRHCSRKQAMSAFDTKFADMPAPVRQRWLDWANSHDWGGDGKARFVSHQNVGECVMETTCHAGGDAVEIAYHATPRELRNWAGY